MIELLKKSLNSQFDAALDMLQECVKQCPDEHWEGKVGNFAFWHVAYHTLFFTDLYLSRDEDSFEAPAFYREDYHFFGKRPWPPFEAVVADVPYERDVILEYVESCRRKAADMISSETEESLAGACGFWWYKVPRAEFYLVNVRHVQHHTAQMSLFLRRVGGIDIAWVGGARQ